MLKILQSKKIRPSKRWKAFSLGDRMESFYIYDATGKPTDRIAERGSKLKDDEYSPVVHVWIKNSKNEYLIHQRNKLTDHIPHLWATVTGLQTIQDSPEEASLRELEEELGLSLNPKDLHLVKTIKTTQEKYRTYTFVYIIFKDIDLTTLTLDQNEVRAVKYARFDEISKMIKEGLFWDYSKLLEDEMYFSSLERTKR